MKNIKLFLFGIICSLMLIPNANADISANSKLKMVCDNSFTYNKTDKKLQADCTIKVSLAAGESLDKITLGKSDVKTIGDKLEISKAVYLPTNKNLGTTLPLEYELDEAISATEAKDIDLIKITLTSKSESHETLTAQFEYAELVSGNTKIYYPTDDNTNSKIKADIKNPSMDNSLTKLNVDGVNIVNKTSYEVKTNRSQINITYQTDKNSKVTLNSDSKIMILKYGDNKLNVTVTSEAGLSRTYTYTIVRPDKRYLAKLEMTNAKNLTPSFDPMITKYTLNVDKSINKLYVIDQLNPEQDSEEIIKELEKIPNVTFFNLDYNDVPTNIYYLNVNGKKFDLETEYDQNYDKYQLIYNGEITPITYCKNIAEEPAENAIECEESKVLAIIYDLGELVEGKNAIELSIYNDGETFEEGREYSITLNRGTPKIESPATGEMVYYYLIPTLLVFGGAYYLINKKKLFKKM